MRRAARAYVETDVEQSIREQLYGERAQPMVTPVPRAARPRGRLIGGRYRLRERVGAGGTAVVHRAFDERLRRDVAVKIIAERLARVPPFVRRFRREAELCARLAHPQIVSILDAGDEPHDFVVMELVRGLDAGTLLRESGRLTTAQAVHVLAQVCDALEYAHDEDVIHRDVSPRNILIALPDGTAKLADFGVPLDDADVPGEPATGVTGTPGYLAPEILRGAKPSPRSDLFALGAVAHRLLAGPADERSGDETAPMATAAVRLPPLADVRPDLPASLTETIQQALADDPDERQDSVAQFRARLVTGRRLQRRGAAMFPRTVAAALAY